MIQITCINKQSGYHQDPYSAIEQFGWVDTSDRKTGKSTLDQMVAFVAANPRQAFVQDQYGNKVYLAVAISAKGNKYVRTITDNTWTDNLLSLNECPRY